jgi:DNA-binding response OmpR family regulator
MDRSADHGRVLVIGDEASSLETYRRLLGEAGFEVDTARDGKEAVQLAGAKAFDVVVGDDDLPGLDGLSLARKVRERISNASVILASMKLPASSIRRAPVDGLQYVGKPVGPGFLVTTVIDVFRRSAGLIFDNRKGDEVTLASFNATDAKNNFRQLLETALRDGAAVIRRHDVPKAVLLSWEEYGALVSARRSQLEALTGDFEGLLARIQAPSSRKAARSLFDASPAELGAAAVRAARKGK